MSQSYLPQVPTAPFCPCWLRRLLTRCLAIAPALIGLAVLGDGGVGKLLVLSQVVLSLQLPLAIVPLILLTSNAKLMGDFVNSRWIQGLVWTITVTIAVLNLWLLLPTFK
ncbi:divalent metal cation transporter [Chamaesiphon minutus]|uniref:divalent metal cation transporter n=1 Tax=Chamaesiphon minutus TaxID=1173032 RepID=UPI000308DD90|nr:divalent metal cation transporter [Chamaesiphon minutus]